MSSRVALRGYRATLSVALRCTGGTHAPTYGRSGHCSQLRLITGCSLSKGYAETMTPSRSMIPRPLVERELQELLLSPEEVNVAMGTTGMTVTGYRERDV